MGVRQVAAWVGAGLVSAPFTMLVTGDAALASTPQAPRPPMAESASAKDEELEALRLELQAQRLMLERQAAVIERQGQAIANLQQQRLDGWRLDDLRAAGVSATSQPTTPEVLAPPTLPDRPVGQAPEPTQPNVEVAAVPEGQGVLTPQGAFVLDPSVEYTRSSNNRLVFRGIELVPGIQIGVIEATDADRDTFVGTLAMRYGLTPRLEVELRVPYVYRYDRIEVVQQRDEGIVREIALKGDGIGDVEGAIRYQLNRPFGQRPIFVTSLRVKSRTGRGPFDVNYDEFGIADGLATGSGFWGISPGVSFLLPSDPVVIYGGASYLFHLARDVDKAVGETFVGRVNPGDAISANIGFGFALNPRFSFSLGYKHDYIFKTRTQIDDTVVRSKELQAGALIFGMSYRLTERVSANLGFQFGVTEDSPDMSATLRFPIFLPTR